MRILFLEPFFGGSHKVFAEGLIRHSQHEIDLYTLPARFWKWRMRGAAFEFFKNAPCPADYDCLLLTNLMSLSDYRGLWRNKLPETIVYFHENQITYPVAPGFFKDLQYGFTDITTALSADRVIFNSESHRKAFLSGLQDLLKQMPEYRPLWAGDAIREKSLVLHPGCDLPEAFPFSRGKKTKPPIIVWNHRWEFDKNPDGFFGVLEEVSKTGLDFRLAVLGERYRRTPEIFSRVRDIFGEKIIHFGFLESRTAYFELLRESSIILSTAWQENFGISVVEAIRCGCLPLLPDRLSYPEIIPEAFHEAVLYKNRADFLAKLKKRISELDQFQNIAVSLASSMDRFSWSHLSVLFDQQLSVNR